MMAFLVLLLEIGLVLLTASTQGTAQQMPNCTGIETLTVMYSIEIPDGNCSVNRTLPNNVTLDLPCGETAQRVMELAVDADPYYYFTVTYYGGQEGYDVIAINGIENEGECEWHLYYQGPEEDEPRFTGKNVTLFTIPDDGTVIMRYDYEPVPVPPVLPSPTPSPTPEVPTEDDDSAISLGGCNLVLVATSILFALVLFI